MSYWNLDMSEIFWQIPQNNLLDNSPSLENKQNDH